MVRMITQMLAGLMLFFGAATLFPKAYFEFKAKKTASGIVSFFLGCGAAFFSLMAFFYAYLILKEKLGGF